MKGIIVSVKNFKNKLFTLGDTATSDNGIFRGVIDGFHQFDNGEIRVHLKVDSESNDQQYFTLNELD